ncbi:hypothetical protein [Streptomyces sp. NPDC051286]|uniref:hypothetical protein n=1 Tax=Streptomyces sp. NPDC051286 TaxID=3365647 RepID=UPI0037941194
MALQEPLPLPGMPVSTSPSEAEQLALLGEPQPVKVPAQLWRSWLTDPLIVARFEAKRHQRTERLCWPWLAAVSSTGHGSFRATSLPGPSRTTAENRAERASRHRNPTGPLADLRGAAGRTRAIAAAVRTGIAAGEDPRAIEDRIQAAEAAGLPLTLW